MLRAATGLGVPAILLFATLALSGCFGGGAFPIMATATGVHLAPFAVSPATGVEVDRIAYAHAGSIRGRGEEQSHAGAIEVAGVRIAGASSQALASGEDGGIAHAVSVVTGLDVLGGLVTADEVRADAFVSVYEGVRLEGSKFTGLRVGGVAVWDPVQPGTTFDVGDVRVVLMETFPGSRTADLTMIHITGPDGLNLRVGRVNVVAYFAYEPGGCAAADATGALHDAGALGAVDAGAARARTRTGDGGGWGNGHVAGPLATDLATAEVAGAATQASAGLVTASGEAWLEAERLAVPGVLTADSALLRARAHSHDGGNTSASWANLVVDGEPVHGDVPPNTVLGPFTAPDGTTLTVTLNAQRVVRSGNHTITDAALLLLEGTTPDGQRVEAALLRAHVDADATLCGF